MVERRPARSAWALISAALVLGAVAAAWLLGLLPGSSPNKAVADKAPQADKAALTQGIVRQGNLIFVPEDSPYRTRLAVAAVEKRPVRPEHVFPGIVEADPARTVNVLPPVGGRVTALAVTLGDHVTAGQALVTVESGDLAQAISDVDKAQATVNMTQKALDRARELTHIGGGAVKDLESATNDYAQATAELERAKTRLKALSAGAEIVNARRLVIHAAISGTITALSTAAGSYINDTTQSLMTISNLDQVFVTANLPEKDVSLARLEEPVDFTMLAYPDKVFHGKVSTISGLLEPDTRRTKVRVIIDNPDGLLKPNMFAEVSFNPPPVDRIVVPSSALLINNDNTTVFVETKPWTFARRTVDPGTDLEDGVIIRKGLSAGDRVVVRGGVLLND